MQLNEDTVNGTRMRTFSAARLKRQHWPHTRDKLPPCERLSASAKQPRRVRRRGGIRLCMTMCISSLLRPGRPAWTCTRRNSPSRGRGRGTLSHFCEFIPGSARLGLSNTWCGAHTPGGSKENAM